MRDDLTELRAALVDRSADLAIALLGEPNPKIKCKRELRWGNHGSLSVKGAVWRDHEAGTSGDLLALIMRAKGCNFPEAVKFGHTFCGSTHRRAAVQPAKQDDPKQRGEAALRIWRQSVDPRGTMVETYLASRGLPLLDDLAGRVLRFHAALYLDGCTTPGMVALLRDVRTDEPCGVIRTFLDQDARKIERRMMGRAGSAAVKLDADENVTEGLHVSEGTETGLSAMVGGYRPVWACGSAGGVAQFPVLSGIEALTILTETNDGGANARATEAVSARWHEAGREVFAVEMLVGDDLNDAWREAAP